MLIISWSKYQAMEINGERKFKILEDNHAPKRGPMTVSFQFEMCQNSPKSCYNIGRWHET